MGRVGKADTHLHTEYSGFNYLGALSFPESVSKPSSVVNRGRKGGYDVICITDHNETAGAFLAQEYAKGFDDIEVVVGEEVMTSDGEIIGLFLTEKIPTDLSIEETVDIIREQGGLTIAPHPFSFHVPGLKERIFDIDLDGFETLNGGHPDKYSNRFAQSVMERHPDRWASIGGSDAHSKYTFGYTWTEFEGNTAEDFRKSILNKKTVPKGRTAPVLGEVQWSMEVVLVGQKLMYNSLRKKLPNREDHALIEKINHVSDLKKLTGILGGFMYLFPPMSFIATLASTSYLNLGARRMRRDFEERLEEIDSLIANFDSERSTVKN
ncbi:PHP domain protein [Candidatus Methanoplasma termitum]|uniref:PHP domain protein n=1 Tax=Candidatus Methanoplasma termitum TaxID=1577791 RepID=A0A0A7LB67_9ARCH|nr:PHP domain-containing protein [Candidatus Methanoplasma termitum]AIZ56248.1 PHP domain protein [Candidatus Methanoplasma termitum]MCL2333650.1 PHP domain-containing protein [Candidatus Methanoplasma sp.]